MVASGVPYFPQILPTGTVVGRSSLGSGPAEVLTFAQLASQIGAISLTNLLNNGSITAGSANAQTLTITPSGVFTLVAATRVSFISSLTNTGSATLNINGTGAITVQKRTSGGLVNLAAGDITSGQVYTVAYDGVVYELLDNVPISGLGVNAQTVGSYIYLASDQGKLVTRTNASAMTDTLPQATGSFGVNWFTDVAVLASSVGALTITPTTSTIDGQTTLVIPPGASVRIVSDGTNYQIQRGQGRIGQIVTFETGAVATGTTTMPVTTDAVPTNSQGDQYMSLALVPMDARSTLLIDIVAHLASSSTGSGMVQGALFQDSGANALASAISCVTGANNVITQVRILHKMTAGQVTSTTFKFRAGWSAANTCTFNGISGSRVGGGTMASSITITEILP